MDDISIFTYLLVFLSVLVPYFAVSLWINSPEDHDVAKYSGVPAFFRVMRRLINVLAQGIGTSLARAYPLRAKRWRNELLKAGYHLTSEQVFGGQIVAAVAMGLCVCFGLFFLKGDSSIAIGAGLVAALVGWFLPTTFIQKKAQERQIEIIRSLPFAIDLLASAMRAGLDFMAAVRYYVTMGGKGPLVVEFRLLLRQMEYGKSRMEALEEMATHVQTQEFTAFVAAVAHGTEIGASIIETLQIQGEDMRRARFNLAERKAARAPSIMIFPIAFFILPAVFAIVFVPVILRFLAAKGGL